MSRIRIFKVLTYFFPLGFKIILFLRQKKSYLNSFIYKIAILLYSKIDIPAHGNLMVVGFNSVRKILFFGHSLRREKTQFGLCFVFHIRRGFKILFIYSSFILMLFVPG